MIYQDDRTEEQKKTHYYVVLATDKFMSGWGAAKNGLSYAGWACEPKNADKVYKWVASRSDMLRIRTVGTPYRPNPKYCAHCHIYVVDENHNSLK
jgi:hypothetical protein